MTTSTTAHDHISDDRTARARARPAPDRRPAPRALAMLVMALIVAGSPPCRSRGAAGTSRPPDLAHSRSRRPPLGPRPEPPRTFLQRYEASNGRVVRRDQGGDTVSEGQGYAMLLAVALGDRRQFAAAWRWDHQPPTPRRTVRLSLGPREGGEHRARHRCRSRYSLGSGAGQPALSRLLLAHGLQVANAILADETAEVAGALQLVAGPWGRSSPAAVDPNYFSVEAMDAARERDGRSTLVRSGRRLHRPRRRGNSLGSHASLELGRHRAQRNRPGGR